MNCYAHALLAILAASIAALPAFLAWRSGLPKAEPEQSKHRPAAPKVPEDARAEYADAGNNLRFYAGLRLAQLGVFVAILGGVAGALFATGSRDSLASRVALEVFGAVVGLAFMTIERRHGDYWAHYLERAKDLERALGFHQYLDPPKRTSLRASHATDVIYLTAITLLSLSAVADLLRAVLACFNVKL